MCMVTGPAYSHIPDLNTFGSSINLLSLCNLVILGNVLDFSTYLAPNQPPERNTTLAEQEVLKNHDRNTIPKQERGAMMFYTALLLRSLGGWSCILSFGTPRARLLTYHRTTLHSNSLHCWSTSWMLQKRRRVQQERLTVHSPFFRNKSAMSPSAIRTCRSTGHCIRTRSMPRNLGLMSEVIGNLSASGHPIHATHRRSAYSQWHYWVWPEI